MKASHVEARINKRTNRCRDSCPGWIVRASPGKPKLMACTACNALQPGRLQITDKMVKLLPAAHDGLGRVVGTVRRARVERATTRHVQVPSPDGSSFVTLCGHSLGRTRNGRRVHVRALIAASATCNKCIRLAAMTPDERDAEKRATSAALRARFADKRDQSVRERHDRHAATESAIELARHDAKVAMDILEEVTFDRTKLMTATPDSIDSMSTFSARAEQRATFVENTLKMAVVAHRHANPKSRGFRRWLFRSDAIPAFSGLGCSVVCRFCAKVLMEQLAIVGNDYTIDTDDHTVRCALEYLGGKLPENP